MDLPGRAVRQLRRDAAGGPRVPIRVLVAFDAQPRPVVRFVDMTIALKGLR